MEDLMQEYEVKKTKVGEVVEGEVVENKKKK